MASESIKLCKDCQIPITKANAYIDRGERLRARCKKCDYKYRSSLSGTDAYSYMDKIFSKLSYEVKSGRRKSRSQLTWNINQAHLYHLYQKQKGKCALSGITMTWRTGEQWINENISLDRIDPGLGYEPGNIQLVCYRCNVMKHNMLEKDFLSFIKSIHDQNHLAHKTITEQH